VKANAFATQLPIDAWSNMLDKLLIVKVGGAENIVLVVIKVFVVNVDVTKELLLLSVVAVNL